MSLSKCLIVSSIVAASYPIHAQPSKTLRALIKASSISETEVGIHIEQVSSNNPKVIFSHQGDRQWIPASVTKIIPMAVSLETFGAAKTFKTELFIDGKQKEDELIGNIYLKGGGDPTFVSEGLWGLVNQFYRQGIREVKGDLIVDDTIFDRIRFDSSRIKKRVDRAYDSPVGGMSFNWNAINVFLRPGARTGDQAKVILDPDSQYLSVDNLTKTGQKGSKSTISVQKTTTNKGVEKLIVSGQVPLGSEEKVFYKSIDHPDLWSGANLKYFLEQRGIKVTGTVKTGQVSPSAQLVAQNESRPLSQIVFDMMKYSNNFVAEMLTKHLALNFGDLSGSLDAGVEQLKTYLNRAGLDAGNYRLLSPSGLSRENSFRPTDLVKLLNYIYQRFEYSAEALTSFPLAGLDGTLKKRLVSQPARLRGKTGLLSGVTSLAGYLQSQKEMMIFVFIYNGPAKKTVSAKALFDQMAKALIEGEAG